MAKRGDGEGSVHQRRDGRWVATVSLGYEGGKRRRKSFYGNTRREVIAKKTAALRDLQQGMPLSDDSVTVGTFLERWLEDSARPTLRPRTYESYAMIVRYHLVPVFGRTRLSKLSPEAVQRYMNDKLEAGQSARSVEYHHSVLRRALGQAARWGIVGRNVAKLVSPPRVRRPEVKPLTIDQARAFLTQVAGDRLEAVFTVALALGLRQSEVLGLSWSGVDLKAGSLSVRRSLQRYGGEYHLDELKTDRSRRSIALPDPVITALTTRRRLQLEDRVHAGPAWIDDGWDLVFTNELGQPMRGSSVSRRFRVILEEAGLPRDKFHNLRHSCASFLLAQSVPMRVVMEILGHSQIQVTANVYSHVMPELQREATERIKETLWGVS